MDKKYILFDLDGTLTDPAEGITNAIKYALAKYGIEVCDKTSLYEFIGPPLISSFMERYGFSHEKASEALMYYREYFGEKGLFENKVYPKTEDMLEGLLKKGKHLFVATSKPEEYSKIILKHFKLDKYFEFIGGSTMDESMVNKDEIIGYVLSSCRITDKDATVMVGDRRHDIIGAKKNCISSIGVLYGYGSREELFEAGADYIISSPEELSKLLGGDNT
ncbi:MAG: HAD family hydrolase [Lachnospiraceae bacterium]|nr:HAD family hydrolase [Lachnospiraceae bacterium]